MRKWRRLGPNIATKTQLRETRASLGHLRAGNFRLATRRRGAAQRPPQIPRPGPTGASHLRRPLDRVSGARNRKKNWTIEKYVGKDVLIARSLRTGISTRSRVRDSFTLVARPWRFRRFDGGSRLGRKRKGEWINLQYSTYVRARYSTRQRSPLPYLSSFRCRILQTVTILRRRNRIVRIWN